MRRPCLECGALTEGSRCPEHRRERDRIQLASKRERRPRISSEDRRRAEAVREWRAEHGDWCPGWQRPPHPATDLTADHLVSFAVSGDEHGELVVLCRSCNSSKSDRI